MPNLAKFVDYSSKATPSDYFCAHCQATGCKLWREYNTFSPQLLCVDCCVKDQKKDFVVNEDGTHQSDYGESDQIGWYVPAVQHETLDAYWSYSAVPDEGVRWWRELPLRLRRTA
jgi:hypothetical protein